MDADERLELKESDRVVMFPCGILTAAAEMPGDDESDLEIEESERVMSDVCTTLCLTTCRAIC